MCTYDLRGNSGAALPARPLHRARRCGRDGARDPWRAAGGPPRWGARRHRVAPGARRRSACRCRRPLPAAGAPRCAPGLRAGGGGARARGATLRLYLDTGALLKLFIAEPESAAVEALCEGAERLICARISAVEAHAALARAHLRQGRLSRTDYATARGELERFWATAAVVPTDEAILDAAQQAGESHGLRAYDAVQLASALSVADLEPILVSGDGELCAAAIEEGLAATVPLSVAAA